jgi:hypothetical protein
MSVLRLPRNEFLEDYWDYSAGQHVSFIEPTQQGKTYLMHQCLDKAMDQNPQLQTVSLMPKPRDPATVYWSQQLGLKEIHAWPPTRWPWQDEPRGYLLWPEHAVNLGPVENRARVAGQFRTAMHEQYWSGDSITVADDIYIMAVLMGLNPECEEFWTAGGGGGAGLWSANQKPSGTLGGGSVSSFSYNAPTHLFLGHDPDARNRQRFGEIGGVDPDLVTNITMHELKMHSIDGHTVSDKLYIDKRGPYLCIVGI